MFVIIGETAGGDGLSSRTKVLATAATEHEREVKLAQLQKENQDWVKANPEAAAFLGPCLITRISATEVNA